MIMYTPYYISTKTLLQASKVFLVKFMHILSQYNYNTGIYLLTPINRLIILRM